MISTDSNSYDFIVVGAGPAGCLAATRLARTPKHPSVLLIEAGGPNDLKSSRIDAERWLHRMNPSLNWGYQTVPQDNLSGIPIPYDRGKGLGGSSSINFSCWTVGPSGDYDEIARIVEDDEWKWTNAQQRYKRIESYHAATPERFDKYLSPHLQDHGTDGPINVGFPSVWEKSSIDLIDIVLETGFPLNLDHNSGNPIGMAVGVNSAHKGLRSTAADALIGAPDNLTVMINTEVARVSFDGKRAVGVETMDGMKIIANREVVLSSGSVDTPRILMHSGIGPKDQLNKFDIPIVFANGHVGQHLMDHHHVMMSYQRAEHTSERQSYYKDKELQAKARAQWEKDQTGPLAEFGANLGVGYFKSENIAQSAEYKSLSPETRSHLEHPTVPLWELITNGANVENFIDPDTPSMTTLFGFVLNQQSRGSVTLASSDPKTPLLIDPNFFSHPYDKRVAIEVIRELSKLANHPAFTKDTVGPLTIPRSDSEEDILDFWREKISSTWHMTGTAVMGKNSDDAVVDNRFRVFGVDGLRVADMSVYPILPNNHTQTNAYLAGLMVGDKMVDEYRLE